MSLFRRCRFDMSSSPVPTAGLSSPPGTDSPRNYLHKGGRKLNDEYFVIKAHRAMEQSFGAPADSVSYVAFCVKTTREVTVTLSGEELTGILGPERSAQLFSEVQAERQAAHQAVIDSLQFEDNMLTSQSQTLAAAAPMRQPVFDPSPASPRVTVGDVPVSSPIVARLGRKVNGAWSRRRNRRECRCVFCVGGFFEPYGRE